MTIFQPHRSHPRLAAFIALMLAMLGANLARAQTAEQTPPQSYGVWANPQNSVHVRAQPCGDKMCGVVIWASDKAKADARRGGTEELIGHTLFRDFTREKEGRWRGRVFVPDIGRTYSGTITVINANRLEGKGCLAGGLLCKTQVWTRLR